MIMRPNLVLSLILATLILVLGLMSLNQYFASNRTIYSKEKSIDLAERFILDSTSKKVEFVSILNFGDSMFGRNVGGAMANGSNPFELINSATSTFFNGFDAILLNLEGPITASTTNCQAKAYSFRFEPSIAEFLNDNKITAVNIANNHTFDCYEKGQVDTKKYLLGANLEVFGDSAPEKSYFIKKIKGIEFAFLGIDLTINYNLKPEILTLIKQLYVEGKLVVVHIHWGEEYRTTPTPYQILIGHKLIDAGAEVVIGHHPHIIEPMEMYKDKPIFYSLGNFIFDQIGEAENSGFGVGLSYQNGASTTVKTITIHPYKIFKHRPQLLNEMDSTKFCQKFLSEISDYHDLGCSVTF